MSKTSKMPKVSTRPHCISRGIAAFIAAFTMVNLAATRFGSGANQNLWWVDFGQLQTWLGSIGGAAGTVIQAVAGLSLLAWSFKPKARLWRKVVTLASVALCALMCLQNSVSYWQSLASGSLYSALPVPLSIFMFAILLFLIWRIAISSRRSASRFKLVHGIAIAAVFLACCLVFPLAQIVFFGTTDYRRNADAVVVMGARVYEDGSLSRALSERMDTAIELFDQGYVDYIIVSGGIETSGSNEADAMAAYAKDAGVPAARIIIDEQGSSTEASVADSLEIADERGFDTLLATSSFYHMPRIKMLYMAQGENVYTVPTVGHITRNGTYKAIWREIPAWWYYWLKGSFAL